MKYLTSPLRLFTTAFFTTAFFAKASTKTLTTAVLLSAVLAVFTLGACAHSPIDDSVDDARNLQMCTQTFHRDMRWRRWESAAMSIVPEHRQAFLGRYQELGDDFHISDLEIKSLIQTKDKAIIDIEQESYIEPAMIVKKKRYIEVWKKVDGGWMVDQRMPKDEYKKKIAGEKKAAKKLAAEQKDAEQKDDKQQATKKPSKDKPAPGFTGK